MPADRDLRLADKGAKLVEEAMRLQGSISEELRCELGRLVRSMNCYYSNLIEGHPTHPVDIDRALAGKLSEISEKRNLQLEALAHIDVQAKIDAGKAPSPVMSVEFLTWTHRTFCEQLPEELLWVTNPDTGKRTRVYPGEFRAEHVRVGDHIAPAPTEIAAMLERLCETYKDAAVSRVYRTVAVAAAHHRLLWIHPFLDGNGRVARLFSHAMLREWGIGSELWSAARGLARNVEKYKRRLADADEPRRGDLDGRGNLTDSGLAAFCSFFLDVCIDQVQFMQKILRPDELQMRVSLWCEQEVRLGRLPPGSWKLLREALVAGSFARGEADVITGYQERQARTVLAKLLERGVLTSDGPRRRVRLAISTDVVEHWLPALYPVAVA